MMNEHLFIGGPECISGTVRKAEGRIHMCHAMDELPITPTNVYDRLPIQTHEYRREEITDSKFHFVYFHSSIQHGDEVAALIQAATKKKP